MICDKVIGKGSTMKTFIAVLLVKVLALHAVSALASPEGRLLSYGGGGEGKVIFDSQSHRAAGYICTDCHSAIFETKKNALITMAEHNGGTACFTCHNGTTAFNECEKCHRK